MGRIRAPDKAVILRIMVRTTGGLDGGMEQRQEILSRWLRYAGAGGVCAGVRVCL